MGAGGAYSCPRCEVRAQRDKPGRGGKQIWPFEHSINRTERTHQRIEEIVALLEDGCTDPDYLKGVKSRSVLLDYPELGLDVIKDIVLDYLHLFAIGVVKRFIENLFFPAVHKTETKPYYRTQTNRHVLRALKQVVQISESAVLYTL